MMAFRNSALPALALGPTSSPNLFYATLTYEIHLPVRKVAFQDSGLWPLQNKPRG